MKYELLFDTTGEFCNWVWLDGYGTVRWLTPYPLRDGAAITTARAHVRDQNAKALFVVSADLRKVEKRLADEEQELAQVRTEVPKARSHAKQLPLF